MTPNVLPFENAGNPIDLDTVTAPEATMRFAFDPSTTNADNAQSMNRRNTSGITLVEVIVVIGIILVLCTLAIPRVGYGLARGPEAQVLSNMKQLQLCTLCMAQDGVDTGDYTLGWPGDLGGSFSNWTAQILKGHYLKTNELCKMLSAQGVVLPPGKIPQMNETAVRLYAVDDRSSTNAVLLTSANFTNTPKGGEPLNPSAKPFGDKNFVVMRKDGSGAILLPKYVGNTNIIGSFVPLCR